MILEQIIEEKKKELAEAKSKVSLQELIDKSGAYIEKLRDFKQAIAQSGELNLIAEIKKASPTQGILREYFDPVEIAKAYADAGACALSILTEKNFFQGVLSHLQAVREEVALPILRKDFIIDSYQIYESLCVGADSILLIARLLSKEKLEEFSRLCARLKLNAVCEVHTKQDLDKIADADFAIIGINNRNLDTGAVDLGLSSRLISKMPKGKIVISESGIKTAQDVQYLKGVGVNAVLIGEAFMLSKDIKAKVRELLG